MSLNKQKMVREIGRRTRLKNRDVQAVIESLMDVWTEELVNGGRIELEGFCVLEVRGIGTSRMKVTLKTGKYLREVLWSSKFIK